MVTWTGLAVAVLLHASAADETLTKATAVELISVQATDEGRGPEDLTFGKGLELVRDAIAEHVRKKKLQLDTFERIAHSKADAPANRDTELAINSRYAAFVRPLSRDENNRIRLTIRIQETRGEGDDKSVRDALKTTSAVASHTPLLLGGLQLDKGQLIAALIVKEKD